MIRCLCMLVYRISRSLCSTSHHHRATKPGTDGSCVEIAFLMSNNLFYQRLEPKGSCHSPKCPCNAATELAKRPRTSNRFWLRIHRQTSRIEKLPAGPLQTTTTGCGSCSSARTRPKSTRSSRV